MVSQEHDLVSEYRGGVLENSHIVHVAISDVQGRLLYRVGDPHRMTLQRSAAKLCQSLAILETGCFDRFDFDDADLALMTASNSSEPAHIERGRKMLEKIGATESDMACGAHKPLSALVLKTWHQDRFEPTPLCSNCSGKHLGMMAAAVAIASPNLTPQQAYKYYHRPEHPLQKHVKQVIEQVSNGTPSQIQWSTDGCNLPAPATPLSLQASTYARFAAAADDLEAGKELSQREKYMARIFSAMCCHPDMVAGTDRFCTTLMQAFPNTVVGKLGADATYGIAVRRKAFKVPQLVAGLPPDDGLNEAFGIAFKIESGNEEVLYVAACEVLLQLGITSDSIKHFHTIDRINTVGIKTGQINPQFKLRPAR